MKIGRKGRHGKVMPACSEGIPRIETISTTELRRDLSSVLDDVSSRGLPYVLTRHGRPEAVLIPYEDYLKFQQVKEAEVEERMARLIAKMGELNAIFPDEEIEADLRSED